MVHFLFYIFREFYELRSLLEFLGAIYSFFTFFMHRLFIFFLLKVTEYCKIGTVSVFISFLIIDVHYVYRWLPYSRLFNKLYTDIS